MDSKGLGGGVLGLAALTLCQQVGSTFHALALRQMLHPHHVVTIL